MSEPRYAIDEFNTETGYVVGENGKIERDSWLPLNLADLPAASPVQPSLGFGLVYPGRRHVFSGPQESAKTLAAYAIGLDIIRATGSPIALIDFEMGSYGARNRLQELGATPADFQQLHYIEPEQPATLERISLVIALSPILVIVDAAAGAYDIQGLDDNKRGDVGKFTRLYVKDFWQAGIATIVLDHVVKNTETRGKYAIGSERKTGGVDVHLGFDTIVPIKRGSTGIYKIVTHKDRDGYLQRGTLAELHLASDPESHRISWEFKPAEHVEPGETWMPTKQMQKVSELLEQSEEPLSRNIIITTVGGSKDYAAKAIDHLVRLKYATETEGPRRAKLIQSLRSFTVYEWEHQPDPPLPPTSPLTSPAEVHSPPPPPVRSTGAVGEVDASAGMSLPPNSDWVDELTPTETEEPPADLWDDSQPNDNIPF